MTGIFGPYGGYSRREIINLLRCDWAYLPEKGRVLHHVPIIEGPTSNGGVGVTGETSCRRRGELFIPGLFSRMGLPRCRLCCRAINVPHGIGSPKNDKAMRSWLQNEIARRDA